MASDLVAQMSRLGIEKWIPSTKNTASFESLPAELRIIIYEYATESTIGASLVTSSGGRIQFRLAWPLSPLDYRSSKQLAVDNIAMVSPQVRNELLPIVMRGFIVKFPAWTPEFKTQCMNWIGDVSETFCRSVDWIWLEGLYWRISIHLVGMGPARSKTSWEDERARAVDMHMHESSETFEREQFVLRVDYQRSAEERALNCARKTVELVGRLLLVAAGNGHLGRARMRELLAQTPLTGTEQHRAHQD
ncbi:hypothetical protein Slin15195_G045750 [Septoria linicola]|uniref:Uncharacterized protein n=1 Tax=Septoria linicola TaxID=215465 RepID=A0A9Q9EGY6_9PEZI|nr:hypothetical protein Slin14017_G049270 [Septoria linicola]USW51256.1 hypothetical protein Slin15195_G045750 [Septoria linicola]